MNLTSDDLARLCELAIEAAVTTGRYIGETRPADVEHKQSGGSLAAQVVTEVDRESQRRILEMLAPSFGQYDLALLTEESPDDGSRLARDYFWCIDPIDGTLSFIEGVSGYAVSIALVSRDGVPWIGVAYDPVGQVTYHAIRDGGAYRNRRRWRLDPRKDAGPPRIFTDQSELSNPRFEPIADGLGASRGEVGGGVMNAIRCLENPPALYFTLPKPDPRRGGCFWDFAATACIYRELGAWVSDARGKPLDLNRSDSIYLGDCGVLFATDASYARRFLDLP